MTTPGPGRLTLLVVAKAPVAGEAKTRIAATIGRQAAASLAAASLLDTLDTVTRVGAERDWPVVVAMTGKLSKAAQGERIAAMLRDVVVLDQRGDGLDERLARAHADAAAATGLGATVQVGMDTPHVTRQDYASAGAAVLGGERVLGPAGDGGWWLLGLPDATDASALVGVPMSTDRTAALTAEALEPIRRIRTLDDMDRWSDAQAIAALAPNSRLAEAVTTIARREDRR